MILRYFAWIKNITNKEEEIINDATIVNIDTLKKYLTNQYPDLKKYMIEQDMIRIAINLNYVSENISLDKDDEVALFPPVSGG
tara:strand:+ start:71 stop:319 length:249 start_codon:yes stop_codon:yes gene_type:complete